MARLRTEDYSSDNLKFKYDVNIDKEGKFSTTIPEEIVLQLNSVGITLMSNRMKREGYFQGSSLSDLKESVEELVDQFSKKELVEEKIILQYSVDTTCSYWKGEKGIYPNGNLAKESEGNENGQWADSSSSGNDCKPYGFKVYVDAKKVKVWKFPNGEIKKEYENVSNEDKKNDEVLNWITSLCHMGEYYRSNVKEIDYTPKVGLFFKNMVTFIFNINENIIDMFGDSDFDLSKIDFNKLKALGFSGDGAGQDKEVEGLE